MGCTSSKAAGDPAVGNIANKSPHVTPIHEVNTQIKVQPSPTATINSAKVPIPPSIVNLAQPISPRSDKHQANKPAEPALPESIRNTLTPSPATEQPAAETSKASRPGSKRGTLRASSRRTSAESKGNRSRTASVEGSVINYVPTHQSNNPSLNNTLTGEPKLKPAAAATAANVPGSTISSTTPAPLERAPSFNTLLKTAHPSLLLSDPAYQTAKISETFNHYFKKRYETNSDRSTRSSKRNTGNNDHHDDEDRIDKKGLGQLATDSVLSFLHVVRETNTWKPEKWEKKEREERLRYLPGQSLSQAVDIAKLYWQQELQYKSGGVTKTMFFFHFSRAYKAMFAYDGKLTIEREALVTKWNKIGPERLEEKAKAKHEKDSARDSGHEKSVSKTDRSDRSARRSSGRTLSKDHSKPRKNRATAPANSISQLLANGGINHRDLSDSKLVQAERKLTSHLSATASEAKNTVRPTSSSSRR